MTKDMIVKAAQEAAARRNEVFALNDLRVDLTARRVWKNGKSVRLTPREYRPFTGGVTAVAIADAVGPQPDGQGNVLGPGQGCPPRGQLAQALGCAAVFGVVLPPIQLGHQIVHIAALCQP